MTKDKWYKDGIDFKCQGCGKCCHGFPGYVWLTESDIINISKLLKLEITTFLNKYTRSINGMISLKELKSPAYECVFFKDNKCNIYTARPFQCSSYPFWPQNLRSKTSWEKDVKSFCPGTNSKKTISHSQEEIDSILQEYKKELPF